jgi:hypothetical protein
MQDTEFIHGQMGRSCCQCIPDMVRVALYAAMDFSAIFSMTVRVTVCSGRLANEQPIRNAKLLLSGSVVFRDGHWGCFLEKPFLKVKDEFVWQIKT